MSYKKYKFLKGSVIVDSACCLPVFIIAICTVLMLIAQTGVEDTVVFHMTKAASASVMAIGGTANDDNSDETTPAKAAAYSGYVASLRSGISDEWSSDSKPGVHLSSLEFDLEETLTDGTTIDHLMEARVKFNSRIPIINPVISNISSEKSIVFRPWVGESTDSSQFDDTHVYIFPKRGEHYHNSSCSCLKNGEIEVVLNKSLRKGYKGCSTCHADGLCDGSKVFLMSAVSEAFHRKNCPCITKAFETVAISDAKSMGYTPCKLCGGTADNYNPENDLFQ